MGNDGPMGIRINTRLGKNTSASVPLGGLLIGGFVALAVVCGAVSTLGSNPWLLAGVLVFFFVVVPGIVLLERRNRHRQQ